MLYCETLLGILDLQEAYMSNLAAVTLVETGTPALSA